MFPFDTALRVAIMNNLSANEARPGARREVNLAVSFGISEWLQAEDFLNPKTYDFQPMWVRKVLDNHVQAVINEEDGYTVYDFNEDDEMTTVMRGLTSLNIAAEEAESFVIAGVANDPLLKAKAFQNWVRENIDDFEITASEVTIVEWSWDFENGYKESTQSYYATEDSNFKTYIKFLKTGQIALINEEVESLMDNPDTMDRHLDEIVQELEIGYLMPEIFANYVNLDNSEVDRMKGPEL